MIDGQSRSVAIGQCCIAFVLFFGASLVHAQSRTIAALLHSKNDSTIVLADNFPDFSSLRIYIDSTISLRPQTDFRIDTARREIVLSLDIRELLFPTNSRASATHKITISYTALPLDLKTSYTRHSLEASALPDSIRGKLDTGSLKRITAESESSDRNDILSNFQKSGSISRGFQVGSNRDLGLTSGFNLQFSGDVAKDVNITGALTEEQTPIQPEGTTQTLNEVDKVFIRIKATDHFTSTLGDFNLDLNSPTDPSRLIDQGPGDHAAQYQALAPLGVSTGPDDPFKAFSQSTFDVISRALIGAEATAQFDQGSVTVAGASPRGEFTTNAFQGQESYQGPYTLSGKNGEPAILIVAGTEHVYVDGVLQTRGERNDYVIDYALAQITFQPRRLITSDSRITIDFEYSDQQYNRSLFAANAKGEMFDGTLKISTTYLREGDNQDAPLDLSLSDSDRSTLTAAGADPTKASKSAVTYAGVDAGGRAQGSYVRSDTSISGKTFVYYRYAPLDTINALYNVSFGYAGSAKGSYTRLAIGQFQFVGPGLADYDTLAYLPLPQLHQVMALSGNWRLAKNIGITGEFASSSLDPNRFAAVPSIGGNAYRIGALYADTLPLVGYVETRAIQRNLSSQFTPIDRIQDVEFERRYGNDVPPQNAVSSTLPVSGELNREADLALHPMHSVLLEGGYGDLEEPQLQFTSSRLYGHAELLEDSIFSPHASITLEHLLTHDSSVHEQALWDRLSTELSKSLHLTKNILTLGARFGSESKRATSFDSVGLASDSATLQSFSYRAINPFASLTLGPKLTLTGDYTYRTDDSARNGGMLPVSYARTTHVTAVVLGIGGFSSTVDLTLRDKHYTDSLSYAMNGGDQSTLLLRLEPRYTLASHGLSADALYEISNDRAARLERVFVPVPQGLGSYYYIGDLNHNGKPDPNEFAPAAYNDQGDFILVTVPTEQLFPTTSLRSNVRLHVDPKDLFGLQKPTNWFQSALANISSESYLKIEETSTDTIPRDIYLFHLSHFRNDSTTINGIMEIGQDFNILENDPDQSYRLHYLERSSAVQYNTGLEHSFQAERSVRARVRPSFEFSNETTLTSATDIATGDTLSVNRPHNTSSISISTDWSYHPVGSSFDYGAQVQFIHAVEHSFDPELSALTDAVTLRSSYAIETRTRLRAEIERDELSLSQTPNDILSLPYALTEGKSIGITWLWRLALDYQFGSGIVATISYDGRNEAGDLLGSTGERITIHNARAEIRANF